jgi:hypothetical protein
MGEYNEVADRLQKYAAENRGMYVFVRPTSRPLHDELLHQERLS